MTPKQKAEEMIHKYFLPLDESIQLDFIGKRKKHAKECALICVDEIINAFENMILSHKKDEEYWQEVKQEIQKL